MTIQEALKILEEHNITSSLQMLRRWIRQGKIVASLPSRKEGYRIDETSLNLFIQKKELNQLNQPKTIYRHTDVKQAYKEGFQRGIDNKEGSILDAIKQRDKDLILKGLFESTICYSQKQLLYDHPHRHKFEKDLDLLEIRTVTLNVLGYWVYDEQMSILIDTEFLAYPNRKLETRVKSEYVGLLYEHFEKNK